MNKWRSVSVFGSHMNFGTLVTMCRENQKKSVCRAKEKANMRNKVKCKEAWRYIFLLGFIDDWHLRHALLCVD